MARIYKQVTKRVDELAAIECSRCEKVVECGDILEFQEVMSWSNTGGYGSIWGDGETVRVDLCQDCTYTLFNGFATYE